MYEHFKEANLPPTYRHREVDCIVGALALQRSVHVVGLSGMGKSNLLRFLVSHPEVLKIEPYALAEIGLLYVDCNKLNPPNSLNFYRECISRIQSEEDLTSNIDEYLLYKQLELALRMLDARIFVVFVIDRFESLYDKTDQAFFSQLRNLRDEARRGRMAFILGSQRPPGDLYDIERLFSDTCWVGPLTAADQAEFFTRHESRLRIEVEASWREVLWRLTGAHPGLLKNAIEWFKRQGKPEAKANEVSLLQDLLNYAPIHKHCHALWQSLTEAEQNFLLHLNTITGTESVVDRLQKAGVIVAGQDGLRIFSPLWETYLRQNILSQQALKPMKVELDATTRRVVLQWRGQTEETVINRDLVFRLLQVLSTDPEKIYSKDEIINMLYQGEKVQDVYDDALFQLVTALRKSLDPLVTRLCPAMTKTCIQNVRGIGYRLMVNLPADTTHIDQYTP